MKPMSASSLHERQAATRHAARHPHRRAQDRPPRLPHPQRPRAGRLTTVRAPAPPLEKLAARSHIAPGTPVLPRAGMNRRSPDPISCAAEARADVGQGHPTRIQHVYRMRTARPPPLTRRPLPCRALIEATSHASRHPLYRDRYERTKRGLGKQRGPQGRPGRPRAPPGRGDLAHAQRQPALRSGRRPSPHDRLTVRQGDALPERTSDHTLSSREEAIER
jgi:hypothetical protein